MNALRRMVLTVIVAVVLMPVAARCSEPGLYSPIVWRGETFSRVITWYDSSDALIDLTSYTAKMYIRNKGGTLLLELTNSSGLTLGGTAGTITWLMTSAQTSLLSIGDNPYDLKLTTGGGTVVYLIYGVITVRPSQTP